MRRVTRRRGRPWPGPTGSGTGDWEPWDATVAVTGQRLRSDAGHAPIDSHHGRWYVSAWPLGPKQTQERAMRAARYDFLAPLAGCRKDWCR